MQNQNEMSRLICFYSAAPHSKKLKKPQQLFALETDNKKRSESTLLNQNDLKSLHQSFQFNAKKTKLKN